MLREGFKFSFLPDAFNKPVVVMEEKLTQLESIRKFVLGRRVIFNVDHFSVTKFTVNVSSNKLFSMR